jgi:O-antigen/teichoic acid export membrane protein
MSLAFVPVYIGYLGIEAYGLIGLFVVIQAWLALLDMGMTPTLTREMARFDGGRHDAQSIWDLLRTLELVCAAAAVLTVLIIAGGAGWLAHSWLKPEDLSSETLLLAVRIAAVVVALRFAEGLYRGALLGLQRQVWFNTVNAGLSTLRALGAVAVLAWVSPTVEAFLAWQAFMALVPLWVYGAKVHGSLPPAPRRPAFSATALRDVARFAAGMMGTTVTVLLLTQVDKLMLSNLLSLEDFGYYALASSAAGALSLLLLPIVTAIYPRMVALVSRGETEALSALYHLAAQLVSAAVVPVAAVIALHAGGVLFVWSGHPELAVRTAPLLAVLAVGTMLNGLMHVPYHLQLAHGWTGLTLKCNVVGVLVLVPALITLVPLYGAIAAAWTWVFLNACYVLLAAPLMFRRLLRTEMRHWYWSDLVLPATAAMLALLLTALAAPASYEHRWTWLGFLVGSLVVTALAAVMAAPGLRDRVLATLSGRSWA